eukprot:TRINITY_DN10677_c0_g2_i2.p1 TRINITY_DN10677_c0_g2~~TRINITY_DN10677_c0_g2_i2.p1  ORF type:complete len:391 (+),score=72.85 TRINITY_DN10677_c0_g2_i2:192-1364(+)
MLALLILSISLYAATSKPVLVIEFLRHGARSPISPQPFFNYTRWKIPGHLTAVGERQHYLLGHLHRQRYIEQLQLLPKTYDPSLIYAQTSKIERTMMTLQSYMLGMYPDGLQHLNSHQLSQSKDFIKPRIELTLNKSVIEELKESAVPFDIPVVHSNHVPNNKDRLLLFAECPLAGRTARRFREQYDKFFNRYNDLWNKVLVTYTNFTRSQLRRHAVSFCDFIICADTDGAKPMFISQFMLNKCKDFIGEHLRDTVAFDPKCIKASSKPIASTVLDWMHKTLSRQTKVKYVIYSAHDTTVIRVLLALRDMKRSIEINTTPPFASNVLFELGDDGKVVVYYNGKNVYEERYEKFKVDLERTAELHISYEEACKAHGEAEDSYWDPYATQCA